METKNTSECKRCGWCCTHVIMHLEQRFSKVDQAWLAARGIVIQGKSVIIPSRCPHARQVATTLDNIISFDGVICGIYETRPLICRVSQCPRPKSDV